MRILGLALAAAVAIPLATAGIANAAPISGNISGNVQENGPKPLNPWAPGGTPLYDDFSNGTGNPSFSLVGDTNIFGTVRHASSTNFKDGWTMTLDRAYKIAFRWAPHAGSLFDGDFNWGGNTFSFAGTGGPSVLGILGAGTHSFQVDATAGSLPPIEDGYWSVHATVVPLPAGAVLLLSALGGLALFRSRKSA